MEPLEISDKIWLKDPRDVLHPMYGYWTPFPLYKRLWRRLVGREHRGIYTKGLMDAACQNKINHDWIDDV